MIGQLVETGESAATIRSYGHDLYRSRDLHSGEATQTARAAPAVLFGQSAAGDAEGMAIWIGEDPRFVPVRLVIRLARPELQ